MCVYPNVERDVWTFVWRHKRTFRWIGGWRPTGTKADKPLNKNNNNLRIQWVSVIQICGLSPIQVNSSLPKILLQTGLLNQAIEYIFTYKLMISPWRTVQSRTGATGWQSKIMRLWIWSQLSIEVRPKQSDKSITHQSDFHLHSSLNPAVSFCDKAFITFDIKSVLGCHHIYIKSFLSSSSPLAGEFMVLINLSIFECAVRQFFIG